MLNFIKIMFLFIFLVMTTAHAADITKEDVMQVIAKIDSAIDSENAKALGNELSEDVDITLNFIEQGEEKVMKLSKEDYLLLLEQGWSQFSDYSYRRSDLKIDLQGAKAFVTATVHEKMIIQEQEYSGKSHEETTIELIDGEPRVTAVVGYSGS